MTNPLFHFFPGAAAFNATLASQSLLADQNYETVAQTVETLRARLEDRLTRAYSVDLSALSKTLHEIDQYQQGSVPDDPFAEPPDLGALAQAIETLPNPLWRLVFQPELTVQDTTLLALSNTYDGIQELRRHPRYIERTDATERLEHAALAEGLLRCLAQPSPAADELERHFEETGRRVETMGLKALGLTLGVAFYAETPETLQNRYRLWPEDAFHPTPQPDYPRIESRHFFVTKETPTYILDILVQVPRTIRHELLALPELGPLAPDGDVYAYRFHFGELCNTHQGRGTCIAFYQEGRFVMGYSPEEAQTLRSKTEVTFFKTDGTSVTAKVGDLLIIEPLRKIDLAAEDKFLRNPANYAVIKFDYVYRSILNLGHDKDVHEARTKLVESIRRAYQTRGEPEQPAIPNSDTLHNFIFLHPKARRIVEAHLLNRIGLSTIKARLKAARKNLPQFQLEIAMIAGLNEQSRTLLLYCYFQNTLLNQEQANFHQFYSEIEGVALEAVAPSHVFQGAHHKIHAALSSHAGTRTPIKLLEHLLADAQVFITPTRAHLIFSEAKKTALRGFLEGQAPYKLQDDLEEPIVLKGVDPQKCGLVPLEQSPSSLWYHELVRRLEWALLRGGHMSPLIDRLFEQKEANLVSPFWKAGVGLLMRSSDRPLTDELAYEIQMHAMYWIFSHLDFFENTLKGFVGKGDSHD